MDQLECDLLIIGAGPSGLYGAYYAGFRGWSVVVMDALDEPGGQVTAMYPEKEIYDVGGFPAVRGRVLVENLLSQAGTYRPTYLLGHRALTLETAEDGVLVTSEQGGRVRARAVVITGGIGSFTPRQLPTGTEWEGRGLVYFVPRLSEHAGRDVVIVGGGDSAFDWALSLHPLARSVTLVHRRDQFRAHAGSVEQVRSLGVRLLTSAEVQAVRGNGHIAEVEVLHKPTGEVLLLPAQTVVAALGFVASIGALGDWGLDLEKRRVVVNTRMATNLPRVYAAGDVTTYPGKVPLISVGFGEVATAVNNASVWVDPEHGIFPGHSSGSSET